MANKEKTKLTTFKGVKQLFRLVDASRNDSFKIGLIILGVAWSKLNHSYKTRLLKRIDERVNRK